MHNDNNTISHILRSHVILTSPVLVSKRLNSATTITDGTQSSPQLIVTFEQHLLTRYSKILIKFALKRDPTGNVAKATCTCLEAFLSSLFPCLKKPPPVALRASRAAASSPRQTFHRAVWLFTRIRFNRIRLIRRRVLEIPSRS